MNPREAMKEVLKLAFEWLEEDIYGGIEFSKEQIDNAIEAMHDDNTFFDQFMEFFKEYIEDFGDNYGLEFDED